MLKVSPSKPLQGEIYLPGDKSISHRALILGALAEGVTQIDNFLYSEDTLATLKIIQQLGIETNDLEDIKKNNQVRLVGKGLKLKDPQAVLNAENSGTTFRLILGVLAGQDFCVRITGDQSLQKRPMKRVTEPLTLMGATFDASSAPITMQGGKLKAIDYTLPVASAQVKSAILLAGLQAKGTTIIREPLPCRDHTEKMLVTFGAKICQEKQIITLKSSRLKGAKIDVPADISSAMFFIVGALIVPGSEILLKNVGLNPTRVGALTALKKMGADITICQQTIANYESRGDILVKYSKLSAVNLAGAIIPGLIDEIPILTVALSLAHGKSIIADAQELKVKESDRIIATAKMLQSFGVEVSRKDDGFVLAGNSVPVGSEVDSFGDHRIAMSAIILALVAKGITKIYNTDCINISFPGFLDLLKKLGVDSIYYDN